jgi:hypothetical protein
MEAQKISKAVTSALTYIEESIEAHTKSDEDKLIQLIWKAASDLEYCLFLFSLINPGDTRSSSWKFSLSKQPAIEVLLTSTQNLLREAAKSLEADDLKDAHKKTWLARGHLLNIHDFYEKNRGKQRLSH